MDLSNYAIEGVDLFQMVYAYCCFTCFKRFASAEEQKKARGKTSPAYSPLMCTFYLEKTEKVLGRRYFDSILLCLILRKTEDLMST